MEANLTKEIEEEGLLYKLLRVTKAASGIEIRKSYKILARRYHPDKNQDDPEAKQKFQKLNQAYKILSDPKKRKIYDTTGEIDGEGVKDISKFIEAYLYYREKYKEITPKDIEEYKQRYVGGEDEEEDLINYFEENEGDMTLVLEAIPYSGDEDKARFIKFFERKLKEGEVSQEYEEMFHSTKDNVQDYFEELDQVEADELVKDLQEQILGNVERRGNEMMANMMARYGGGGGNFMIEEEKEMNDLENAILGNAQRRHEGFIQRLEEVYGGEDEEEIMDKVVSKKGRKKRKKRGGKRKREY